MNTHDLLRELKEDNGTKIVLLVADGLGGLPMEPGGKTELESARTPHLDALAREGTCGLSIPVLPGITPGSGPGHLGLFGYDPLKERSGRGDSLHRDRDRADSRPPRRPADYRPLRPHLPQAPGDSHPRHRSLRR